MTVSKNENTQTHTEEVVDVYSRINEQHTPRLFVQESCLENCSKLRNLAGKALVKSQIDPETQFDVVCAGKKSIFCKAALQATGFFGNSFGEPVEGTEDHFLVDPTQIETGAGTYTHVGRIKDALEAGANVYSPADLSRKTST